MIIAHNAVFDLRQLSKLTGGLVPERIWDTQSMARLIHPAVDLRYKSCFPWLRHLHRFILIASRRIVTARQIPHASAAGSFGEYAQDDARLSLQIYLAQRQPPTVVPS
ncbi:MAG: hypothetical protein IPK52_15955 [Chloroflexi bacterium]|nr:hypothetical protein [Chloroflexota bacterium]